MDLVIKSKIKEAVKGMNVSSSVADALNKRVEQILKEAADRAKANNRKTVMSQDI